ncbi:hypothetical protein L798_10652 [Zootermopsis nevadensis]|uniref:Uncharacterized protein n=1 Tax=Zootermopsis nevadensis TaxID=136037 RepID=A0A067QZL3_ZOONE|nr:hypothetical protein L798_10652 [Zootermopsis nevadensis]
MGKHHEQETYFTFKPSGFVFIHCNHHLKGRVLHDRVAAEVSVVTVQQTAACQDNENTIPRSRLSSGYPQVTALLTYA